MTEQDARIVINRKLIEAGWKLEEPGKNVLTEQHSGAGYSDYLLLGKKNKKYKPDRREKPNNFMKPLFFLELLSTQKENVVKGEKYINRKTGSMLLSD